MRAGAACCQYYPQEKEGMMLRVQNRQILAFRVQISSDVCRRPPRPLCAAGHGAELARDREPGSDVAFNWFAAIFGPHVRQPPGRDTPFRPPPERTAKFSRSS